MYFTYFITVTRRSHSQVTCPQMLFPSSDDVNHHGHCSKRVNIYVTHFYRKYADLNGNDFADIGKDNLCCSVTVCDERKFGSHIFHQGSNIFYKYTEDKGSISLSFTLLIADHIINIYYC